MYDMYITIYAIYNIYNEYYSAITQMKFCHLRQPGWKWRTTHSVKKIRHRKPNTSFISFIWKILKIDILEAENRVGEWILEGGKVRCG